MGSSGALAAPVALLPSSAAPLPGSLLGLFFFFWAAMRGSSWMGWLSGSSCGMIARGIDGGHRFISFALRLDGTARPCSREKKTHLGRLLGLEVDGIEAAEVGPRAERPLEDGRAVLELSPSAGHGFFVFRLAWDANVEVGRWLGESVSRLPSLLLGLF